MKVILYDEGADSELDIREIARYLVQKISKAGVEVRGRPFFSDFSEDMVSHYARAIAGTKVQGINQKALTEHEPLSGEVEYEKI